MQKKHGKIKLMVGLFDGGTKDFQSLIDLYTNVTDKVEEEKKRFSEKKDAIRQTTHNQGCSFFVQEKPNKPFFKVSSSPLMLDELSFE